MENKSKKIKREKSIDISLFSGFLTVLVLIA